MFQIETNIPASGVASGERAGSMAGVTKSAPASDLESSMKITAEVIAIGDSLGIILTREVLEKLRAGIGDTLYLTVTAKGIWLTRDDPRLDLDRDPLNGPAK